MELAFEKESGIFFDAQASIDITSYNPKTLTYYTEKELENLSVRKFSDIIDEGDRFTLKYLAEVLPDLLIKLLNNMQY